MTKTEWNQRSSRARGPYCLLRLFSWPGVVPGTQGGVLKATSSSLPLPKGPHLPQDCQCRLQPTDHVDVKHTLCTTSTCVCSQGTPFSSMLDLCTCCSFTSPPMANGSSKKSTLSLTLASPGPHLVFLSHCRAPVELQRHLNTWHNAIHQCVLWPPGSQCLHGDALPTSAASAMSGGPLEAPQDPQPLREDIPPAWSLYLFQDLICVADVLGGPSL